MESSGSPISFFSHRWPYIFVRNAVLKPSPTILIPSGTPNPGISAQLSFDATSSCDFDVGRPAPAVSFFVREKSEDPERDYLVWSSDIKLRAKCSVPIAGLEVFPLLSCSLPPDNLLLSQPAPTITYFNDIKDVPAAYLFYCYPQTFRKSNDGSYVAQELIIFGHYFSKKTSARSHERVRCRFSVSDGTQFVILSEEYIQRYENPSKVVASVPNLPVGRYFVHVLVERGGEWRINESQYFEINITADGSPETSGASKLYVSDQESSNMFLEDIKFNNLFESDFAVDGFGFNVLHDAVLTQKANLVSQVLQQAESAGIVDDLMRQKDHLGHTPVSWAVQMCDAPLLKLLLRSSSRSAIHWVNTLIWNDQTPLFTSVHLDDFECVKLLLESGSNPNHRTLEGDSLLDYCDKYGVSQEIRDALIQYGATSSTSLSM